MCSNARTVRWTSVPYCVLIALQAWEILHKGLGYLVLIMAMAAMFLGMMQISPEASMAAKGIYAAWVAILITAWFVMSIVNFVRDRNEPMLPTKADSKSVEMGQVCDHYHELMSMCRDLNPFLDA